MNEDITILKAQVGLTYEKIDGETGQWKRMFESWYDLPLGNTNHLERRADTLKRRQDYRNIQWAWRGVMTNTIIDSDLEGLCQLGERMVKPPREKRYVVAAGSVFLGTTLLGPFTNDNDAAEWAEAHDVETWDVVRIREP